MAKTDTCLKLEEEALKPLHDDALRIADGTWDSYHNNQEQANAIEAFLSFDGGDRNQLCAEIWDKASTKIIHYWREGTFDALKELRTGELYERNYSRGRGILC